MPGNPPARRSSAAGRPRCGGRINPPQIEKLVPQPQEAVALGLWILKDWPIRSSTKSISEPPRYSSDTGSISTRAPSRSITRSSGSDLPHQVELVLEARAAAALHADAQHRRGGLAGDDLGDAPGGALGDGDRLAHGGIVDLPARARFGVRWPAIPHLIHRVADTLVKPGFADGSQRSKASRGRAGPASGLGAAAGGLRNPGRASAGRVHAEPACPMRTPFQRDRDRIVHATAFRRLTYKTQVFVFHEGDHYRTRLTHCLEVAQIARAIARMLALDEDLAEALALAHDLGHPPFGHAGERALAAAMAPYGGFDHNAQSFKVVTRLERKYASFDGLNLTLRDAGGPRQAQRPADGPGRGEACCAGRSPRPASPTGCTSPVRARRGAGRRHRRRHRLQQPRPRRRPARRPPQPRRSGRRAAGRAASCAQVPRAGVETQRVIYEINRRIITAMIDDVVRELARAAGGAARPSLDGVRAPPSP